MSSPLHPRTRAALEGVSVVLFTAAGNQWTGQNSPYDVDYLVCVRLWCCVGSGWRAIFV